MKNPNRLSLYIGCSSLNLFPRSYQVGQVTQVSISHNLLRLFHLERLQDVMKAELHRHRLEDLKFLATLTITMLPVINAPNLIDLIHWIFRALNGKNYHFGF